MNTIGATCKLGKSPSGVLKLYKPFTILYVPRSNTVGLKEVIITSLAVVGKIK
ncbi:MAG: hypothetical protein WCH78_11545 [Bacteroidota bacterium]